MGDILISKSDSIPTKKTVAVLGNVSAKKAMWASERPDKCFEELKKKAEKMGADGIINVTYEPSGVGGFYGTCHGLAVKLEDADRQECPKCNKELPSGKYKFCPHCGSSLV
jgi:ribosomal protein S27AE